MTIEESEIQQANFVSVDIETNGLGARDEVIAIGFKNNGNTRIYYVGEEIEFESEDGDETITLKPCETEVEMLESVGEYARSFNPDNTTLVMHNGQRRYGGFDVPHLRTRCAINDVNWVFEGLDCVDTMDVIKSKFNTKKPTLDSLNKQPLKDVFKIYEELYLDDENVILDGTKSEIRQQLESAIQNNEEASKNELITEAVQRIDSLSDTDVLSGVNGLDDAYDILVGESVHDPIESAEVPNSDMDDVVQHLYADLVKTDGLRKTMVDYGWNNSYGLDSNITINKL